MPVKKSKSFSPSIPENLLGEFPPFPGFDRIGLTFLKQLASNNRREWFTPEKKELYRDHLVEPMRMLLAELRLRFSQEQLPFEPDPTNGLFRLYRDTRFSKDKTPFKTHIGAAIPYAGERKEGLGNYLHIEPGGCFYGGGAYFMESKSLRLLRTAIADDPETIRRILADLERNIGPLQGQRLKRGPVGFDRDHPAIDLILYTQMWVSKEFPDSLATSRELVDWIVIKTHETVEFNSYLHDAMRG